MSPAGSGRREPRVSTTIGLIVSIAGTAAAGLVILIVLLYPVFRSHPAPSAGGAQSSSSSSTTPVPTVGGVIVPSASSVQIVVVPSAITVTIAGGDSGLPEWSPILVAVIGVLGAIGSAFVGYFVQRERSESNREPQESSTSQAAGRADSRE